jgi:hypothetical protein
MLNCKLTVFQGLMSCPKIKALFHYSCPCFTVFAFRFAQTTKISGQGRVQIVLQYCSINMLSTAETTKAVLRSSVLKLCFQIATVVNPTTPKPFLQILDEYLQDPLVPLISAVVSDRTKATASKALLPQQRICLPQRKHQWQQTTKKTTRRQCTLSAHSSY